MVGEKKKKCCVLLSNIHDVGLIMMVFSSARPCCIYACALLVRIVFSIILSEGGELSLFGRSEGRMRLHLFLVLAVCVAHALAFRRCVYLCDNFDQKLTHSHPLLPLLSLSLLQGTRSQARSLPGREALLSRPPVHQMALRTEPRRSSPAQRFPGAAHELQRRKS